MLGRVGLNWHRTGRNRCKLVRRRPKLVKITRELVEIARNPSNKCNRVGRLRVPISPAVGQHRFRLCRVQPNLVKIVTKRLNKTKIWPKSQTRPDWGEIEADELKLPPLKTLVPTKMLTGYLFSQRPCRGETVSPSPRAISHPPALRAVSSPCLVRSSRGAQQPRPSRCRWRAEQTSGRVQHGLVG